MSLDSIPPGGEFQLFKVMWDWEMLSDLQSVMKQETCSRGLLRGIVRAGGAL